MTNIINECDIRFWNKHLQCKNCKKSSFCYKYGSYGTICTGYDDTLPEHYFVKIINDYIQSNLEHSILQYNPERNNTMVIKVLDTDGFYTSSAGDTLYGYHVKYINDILKQIRKDNEDYVYDIKKLLILSSYEPNIKVVGFKEGCYYIRKS